MGKNVLGLISKQAKGSYASFYEKEAYHFYDEVIYIDPHNVQYIIRRGGNQPEIICNGMTLNELSMVYILSPPAGTWKLTILLIKYLIAAGCPISDSFEMFRRDGIGKAYETLLSQKKCGTTSYIVSSHQSGKDMIQKLSRVDFPLILKPVYGHHGLGLQKADNAKTAIRYLKKHFSKTKNFLILEKYIPYTKEWRIYVVDGHILGSYGKSPAPGSFIANLHQGATTKQAGSMEDIYSFIKSNLPVQCKEGIYGLDVGLSPDDEIHVIETNRCPGWTGLKGTGINFPYEANRILFNRARNLKKDK